MYRIPLALIAAAWLPANHYHPWPTAWQDGWAMTCLLVAALLLPGRTSVNRSWLAFAAVVILSAGLQWLSGVIHFAGDAWMVVLYVGVFLLALAVGSGIVQPGSDAAKPLDGLDVFCLAVLAVALASLGIGLAQWAGVQRLGIFGADLAPRARPFANFGQPNHWCLASFIGLCSAWLLFERQRLGKVVLTLCAAALLSAMVISGARAGWLQLVSGVVVAVLWRRRLGLRLSVPAALGALAAFALASLAWPHLNADAAPGVVRTLDAQLQPGPRLPLWSALVEAIVQRPWVGYGWQQMVMAQQAVSLQVPPIQYHFEHAHNLLLDLALWAGVPIAVVLVVLAGSALVSVAQARQARAVGPLLAIVAGTLAYSLVEFPVEYAYFLVPLGVALGAAHRLSGAQGVLLSPMVVRGSALLLSVLLLLVAIDYLKAEVSHRMLRLESARIGTTGIQSPPPDLRVLDQLEAFLTFARTPPQPGLSAEQVDFSRRVSERFAYPPAQFRHAQVLALNGDPEGAGRLLRVLCAMHPKPRCQEAIDGWTALQAQRPEFRAVPAPPLPR